LKKKESAPRRESHGYAYVHYIKLKINNTNKVNEIDTTARRSTKSVS